MICAFPAAIVIFQRARGRLSPSTQSDSSIDKMQTEAEIYLKALKARDDEIKRLRDALKRIAYGGGEWLAPPEKIAREALGMPPAEST